MGGHGGACRPQRDKGEKAGRIAAHCIFPAARCIFQARSTILTTCVRPTNLSELTPTHGGRRGSLMPFDRVRAFNCALHSASGILIVALLLIITPLAHASPPDEIWVAGIYDAA